jgi:periplasmic divalent cation tolerance protein
LVNTLIVAKEAFMMKIALTNLPPEHGERIARVLVEEHVVACVNLYPIHSMYFWKGEVRSHPEVTLMMKVSTEGVERLKHRILELHPYELPEFVVLDVDNAASLREYIDFVRSETRLS